MGVDNGISFLSALHDTCLDWEWGAQSQKQTVWYQGPGITLTGLPGSVRKLNVKR